MNRRDLMTGLVTAGASLLFTPEGSAAEPSRAPGTPGPGKHVVAPLPFNPAKLKGLSEKLLRGHHENNYGGAVKNLNKVEEELARVTKDTPAFLVGGLKERELTFTNSVILHEAYFGNLGGEGKASGPIQKLLAAAHGDFGRWEEHFRATGASLGGGSGWVLLTYNFHSGQPQTYWSGNHTQALAHGYPLLVMDMYEHAYQMDYGAAASRYIDAFFQNVSWDVVNARLERAHKAAAVLRG